MSKDLTNKLIKKGTGIIEKLNNYRRGICSFDKMYDLGFEVYWDWKKEVFSHLSDNGIDEVKLDYLWEDDILNRDYLKTSLAVENQKTKSKALDEVTGSVNRLIKELIELKPSNRRLKIVISNKKGIYRSENEKMCYPLRGLKRFKIIRLLDEGIKDGRSICLSFDKNSKPNMGAVKNINRAVDEINKLFRDKVCDEFNLIIKHGTKKYELNKDNFEIIFTE